MRHEDEPLHDADAEMRSVQSVTSAPTSAADEQAQRVRRYLATMAFRVVCTILAIVASGWVRWTLIAAAVVLPYFAVVMANAVGMRSGTEVAPVERRVSTPRPLDAKPQDDTDRTIHGHIVD